MGTRSRPTLLLIISVCLILAGLPQFVSAQSIRPVTVNMFSGRQLYGFGDVASNLIMAQNLVALRPELRVQFLVGETEAQRLGILMPQLKSNSSYQFVDGIHFYFGDKLPPADIFLAFSVKTEDPQYGYARDVILPSHLTDRTANDRIDKVANSPVIVKFREYGGDQHQVSAAFYNEYRERTEIEVSTGLAAAGIYVNPFSPISRATSPKESGFSYTTYSYATLVYIKSALQAAKENPSRLFEIHVRDFPDLDRFQSHLQNVPNLRVIRIGSSDFNQTKTLIERATLPVMVTGDVSKSLAIQFGQPFLYELHSWKRDSVKAFLNHFQTAGFTPTEIQLLQKAMSIPAPEGPFVGSWEDIPSLRGFFEATELHKKMANTFSRLSYEASLPLFVVKLIDNLSGLRQKDRTTIKRNLESAEIRMAPGMWQVIQLKIRSCFSAVTGGKIQTQNFVK